MSKDPAFLFYPGDWLGGTLGMSFEEKGAYIELLMLQFNKGHMTDRMIGQVVGQIWVNIQDKFKKDSNGLWYNERLDIEKEKRKNYVNSRNNNVLGKNQHSKDKKKKGHIEAQTTGHMTSHMEDEDINENKDSNVNTLVKEEIEFFKQNFSSHNLHRSLIEIEKVPKEKIPELIEIFIDQKTGFNELNGKTFNDLSKNFYYWVPKYLKAKKQSNGTENKKPLRPTGFEPTKDFTSYGKL